MRSDGRRSSGTTGASAERAGANLGGANLAGAWIAPVMTVSTAAWMIARARIAGTALDASVIGPTIFALVGGLVVVLDVGGAARSSATLFRWLALRRARAAIALGLASVLLGVLDAMIQQRFTWDETLVHAAATTVARDGLAAFFASYARTPWLGRQHPPLVPMLHGAAMSLLGEDLLVLRLVSVAFGAFAVVTSFVIGEKVYERRTALAGALLLLASPLFRRLSSAAMNDLPVTALFCAALLATLALAGRQRRAAALLLGFAVGTGLLCKYTMILVVPVVVAILAVQGRLRRSLGALNLAAVVAAAIFGTWIVGAWANGLLDGQIFWLGHMAGVASRSGRGVRYALDGLLTKLPSGLGIWLLPLLCLGARRALRERRPGDRIVALWAALVCGPLLLTLPDNRYFLPAYPAFALLAARGLGAVRPEHRRASLLLLALVLCASVLLHYALVDLGQRAFLFGNPYRSR